MSRPKGRPPILAAGLLSLTLLPYELHCRRSVEIVRVVNTFGILPEDLAVMILERQTGAGNYNGSSRVPPLKSVLHPFRILVLTIFKHFDDAVVEFITVKEPIFDTVTRLCLCPPSPPPLPRKQTRLETDTSQNRQSQFPLYRAEP